MKGTMRVLVLGSSPKVMGRVVMPIGVIASSVNPVKVEVMGMRCRGVVTTRGRAAYYDIYLPLHGAFRTKRLFAWLPYKPAEVTLTYEVFNLVLQIVALLGVMSVVAVEVAIALVVTPLSPHWIGGFEKPFLSDLEEDLSPSRVEWGVGEPGDDLLNSLCPFP
ncbi:hypothetical protein BHE74_00035324 [Ensete ventricosum]|nr:hypothetical protein BHE74_00035324 [Ensete ventricosum]RZS06508.1 hypothetical protein BHM03_00037165 [Ensete ventricosum]